MKKVFAKSLPITFIITLLVTLSLGLILNAQAQTYTQNSQCLECHQPVGSAIREVDFTVTPPITGTNCGKCHNIFSPRDHPPGYNWNQIWYPGYNGYYLQNPDLLSAEVIHKYHSGPTGEASYVLEGIFYGMCGSCHERVSCDACHTDVPHREHTKNAYAGDWQAWSSGYPANPVSKNLDCSAAECHGYMPYLAEHSTINLPANTGSFNPNPQCLTCHSPASTDPFGVDRSEPHGYDSAKHEASIDPGCQACHYSEIGDEHMKRSSSQTSDDPPEAIDCATCHDIIVGELKNAGGWDKSCEQCHGTYAPAKHDPTSEAAAHDASQEPNAEGCLGNGCHAADVRDNHNQDFNGNGIVLDCAACHQPLPTNPEQATIPQTLDCTTAGCHETTDHEEAHDYTFFPPNSTGCGDCHQENVAFEHEGRTYTDESGVEIPITCATCHSSDDPNVLKAISDGKNNNNVYCTTCHTDFDGHYTLHEADPPITDPTHYGVNSCELCHNNNLFDEHLTKTDEFGNPYNCNTCHGITDPNSKIYQAIDQHKTNCDACHDIHGDLGSIHETSTTNFETECSTCHYSNLMSEHSDQGYGCSACHGDNASELVKLMVAQKRTDCAACHGEGAGDHEADHDMTDLDPSIINCSQCHVSNVFKEHVTNHGRDCSICHNTTWQGVIEKGWSNNPNPEIVYCKDCHGVTDHQNKHLRDMLDSPDCGDCHSPTGNIYDEHILVHGRDCTICHDSGIYQAIVDDIMANQQPAKCSTCHPGAGHFVREPYFESCVFCHSIGGPGNFTHDYHTAPKPDGVGAQCTDCHGENAPGCASCHDGASNIHNLHPTIYNTDCTFCHKSGSPSPGPIVEPYKDSCDQCHEIRFPGDKDHDWHTNSGIACTQCHGNENPGCVACHDANGKADIHDKHDNKVPDCTFCHKSGVPDPGPVREPYKDSCSSPDIGCHALYPGDSDHPEGLHDYHTDKGYSCTECHGETAPGCVGCHEHSVDEIHGESDHPDDCFFCHKSGPPKPHSDIPMDGWNEYVEGKGWRVCRICHDSQLGHQDWPRRDCRPCHAPGTKKSVHRYSNHMDKSSQGACFVCHEVSSGDQGLNCTNCHPKESYKRDWH